MQEGVSEEERGSSVVGGTCYNQLSDADPKLRRRDTQYERLVILAVNCDEADGIMVGAAGDGCEVNTPCSSELIVAALEDVAWLPGTLVWFLSEVWRRRSYFTNVLSVVSAANERLRTSTAVEVRRFERFQRGPGQQGVGERVKGKDDRARRQTCVAPISSAAAADAVIAAVAWIKPGQGGQRRHRILRR